MASNEKNELNATADLDEVEQGSQRGEKSPIGPSEERSDQVRHAHSLEVGSSS